MVQLATERTALFLYTVLVLLPAAVFGGLLWFQLSSDHRARLEAVPREAEGAMARLRNCIREVVEDLLRKENERKFFHYTQDASWPAIGYDGPWVKRVPPAALA